MQDVVKSEGSGNVQRHSRSGNLSLYYGLIAFVAFIIFAVLSVTVFFNVDTIIVKGSSIYTAEEIAAASGIQGGDNMIRRNMGKAAENITSGLVYIETAVVKRKFPTSLEITVTPCEETACFDGGEDGGYSIVSRTGKILAGIGSPAEGLPVFNGTEPAEGMTEGVTFASADEHKTEVIYELMDRIDSPLGSKITSYDVTDRLNISCMYEDRIEIELGVVSDLDYKYRFANEILTTRISPDMEGRLRMLKTGAQLLSGSDLEQIEQTYEFNMQNAVTDENGEIIGTQMVMDTESEDGDENGSSDTENDTSGTTKLNFE